MTIPELAVQYESRIRELQAGVLQARFHGALAALLLAVAVGLLLMLSVLALRHQVAFVWGLLPIPLIAASAYRFQGCAGCQSRMWRLRRYYDRALQRIQGNWMGHGASGEEFSDPDHVYARDLNLFGEGSLFELLCTARTGIGQRGLAAFLTEAPDAEETILRQHAVLELRERVELRESVASLGNFEFSESQWETFAEWLDFPVVPFSSALRIAALISSTLTVAILAAAVASLLSWIWITPLVIFHSIIGLALRKRVNRMIGWLRPIFGEIQVLSEGLQLLERLQFQSIKLRQLSDGVKNSSRRMRTLEGLLNALNERNKEWFYGPSLLLLAGTQLCMAIEQWRIAHRAELRGWLDAWAEFEALNSFANYAYENPDHTFPNLLKAAATFEAESLGHPLLPAASCVRNDIGLNEESRFYIVSGSNMSGKSTLLRAIGLNAVLALAGAPVRARALRLSQLSICASLSVVDSLLNGKSKFMAEVGRLRQMIEAPIDGKPVLFLIDEIFSGTNSRDRRIAAEAVVRTLLDAGAIGVLSTHDLVLTEIATPELRGVNVHTGSRDGSDPMDFDYRLKRGITTEANALAIARMAGVPV